MQRINKKTRVAFQLICLSFSMFFLFPVALMITKSFENGGFANYVNVLKIVNISRGYLNSAFIVGFTLLFVALICSCAAFAFSKLRFRGKDVLYYLLLMGMMIPTSASIFPLFQVNKALGLINSRLSLIGPYITMNAIFNLVILKNYYDGLPDELMEAAVIDGANPFKVFVFVYLRLSLPGLALVLIQTFLSAWNELQMGMTFINDPAKQPVAVLPLKFAQTISGGYPLPWLYACLTLSLLPIVLFYLFAQKFLIASMTEGSVKG